MMKPLFFLLLVIGWASPAVWGQNGALKGQVTDGTTGRPLPGASITVKGLPQGTRTDSSGRYNLALGVGSFTVSYSTVGYGGRTRFVMMTVQDQTLDVVLYPDVRQIAEVTVTERAPDANVSANQMSVVRLDMKNLRTIPVVFGEVDVLKALTLQPGVTTVGEGANGFNVRGGRADQNLVLVDGAPLFNTAHLLGFLSNLNADAVQDVTLYKGGMPARYGGRLSSLLLINTKSGEVDQLTVTGGVGLLTSRLLVQTPLDRRKRLTLVAGGRIAYPNPMLRLFPAPTNQNRAFFYDVNGRLTYRTGARSRLTATVYHSYDNFKFPQDTLYGWRNTVLTARWSAQLNAGLSVNVLATQSDYRFFLNGLWAANTYQYTSTIRQQDGRVDWLWTAGETAGGPRSRLEWGGAVTRYALAPGSIVPTGDGSNINRQAVPQEQARDWSAYVSEEWRPLRWLSVQAGLRYVQFANIGPGVTYQYTPGQPRSAETILDTLRYDSGQPLARYRGLEPRVSLQIGVSRQSSVKMSYNRTRQYLHQISNTTSISPVDFWKVSDALVPPQLADQWALGVFHNAQDNTYEAGLEGYYKTLDNLIEYRNGATLLLNQTLDADLLRARGKAYGVEVSVQKTKGVVTGLAAYTYARTFSRVNSAYPRDQINGGNWYPSTFDRPHNVTFSTQWRWSRGWTFGTNFVYYSGRPTTYPDGTYRLNGAVVLDYSQRNADRIPDYHRLDVSFVKDTRRLPDQRRYSQWVISLYNVYARKNPYSIYFQRVNTTVGSYQLSVFGTIIPSVSYNFTF